jgi:hypothetical protein
MKPKYAKTKTAAAALCALAALSCSAANALNDPVVITSDPAGAEVHINGILVGTTPFNDPI